MPIHLRGLVVVALLCLVTACSDGSPAHPSADGGSAEPPRPAPAPVTSSVPSPTPDPACNPGPGREVELLPDVVVPAVEVPTVQDEDGTVLVAAFTVPAHEVDGGCVVREAAPGGCLGAVEITGATIPPLVIPEATVGDRTYPGLTLEGTQRGAVRAEQVCRLTRDGKQLGVTRAGVVREGFSRFGGARPGDDRVPTVSVPPVRLPDVDVDPERLESRPLGDDLSVLQGRRSTSYVAPAGVLFDSDQSTLRPEAVAALRAVVRRIRAAGAPKEVLVEGHTDDRGDEAHGMRLSRARARTVADWLEREAGLQADRITTRGFGETRPAHPNTSDAGRARNRRVVITVRR